MSSGFYHVPVATERLVVALVGLALVAAACTKEGAGQPGSTSFDMPAPHLVAENAAVAPLLPTDAYALPDADPASYQALLGQLRGTPVVVNIWGSWCPPCRSEAPLFAAAHTKYGDRVQFLGIDILDSREGARDFMKMFGWSWPSLYDAAGDIRDDLGYIGQPITIFYDADGDVAADWAGAIDEERLDAGISEILP